MKQSFFTAENVCPLGNGGGIVKYIADVHKLLATDLGAIEIGSITVEDRPGNEGNVFRDMGNYTLNSIGLKNPGFLYYQKNLGRMIQMIHEAGKTAIVNVAGFSKEEYCDLTNLAFEAKADLVNLNYGCPNVGHKEILSYNNLVLRDTTLSVIRTNKESAEGRIGMKLSPIFRRSDIEDIASFLNILYQTKGSSGYIGFVTTTNTIPNCYEEDGKGDQLISPNNGLAGMAGPAILPISLSQVKQWRSMLESEIKIMGIGGISTGSDIKKMMKNGADRVQAVSVYYDKEDPGIFQHMIGEYLS